MNKNYTISFINLNQTIIIFLLAGVFLAGCGNSEQTSSENPLLKNPVKKYTKDTTLSGMVVTDSGPLKTGTVEVTDNKGAVIATALLDDSGRYSVEIPMGTSLPIVLTAYPEAGSVNEKLVVAVVEPTLKKYDINTLTTTIAKKAKSLGGYTYANMRQAAMSSTSIPDANKTTEGFRGDPTKQYGGWH